MLTLAFLLQGVSVHAQEPAVDQEPQFPEGELLSVTEVTVGEDSQVTVTQPEQQVPEESEGALSHDQLVSRAALQGVTGQVDGVNGSVIRGWAWDSSRPNTALEVHIYIKNSSGTTVNAISGVMANKYRADLKNAGYGNGYHGYEYAYNFYAHPLGKYTVTVYAISGTGNNPTIGSKTFTHEAWGMLEEVSSTRIKGWAWLSAKPNEAAQVHIYVKNSAGTTVNAIPNVAADIYRSDLPGNGKHGFSRNYEWAAHAPGTYTVEAYVISGKGNNPALGLSPKTYSNGSYTRGALETVTANGMTGWAFKSSALNTSIPVDLRIWKPDGTFDVKHTVADIYRNDMSRFGNGKHGFSYKMDWSGYPDGVYTVVAYAIDGGSNPEIGRKRYITRLVEYAEGVGTDRPEVKVRWVYKEGSKYTLNVRNYLPENHIAYDSVYNAIVLMNKQTPSNIQVTNKVGNVFYIQTTQSGWDELNLSSNAEATTAPKAIDGTVYYGYDQLKDGTTKIDGATIIYPPEGYGATKANHNYIAMHEMLHVFGLGHKKTLPSLTYFNWNIPLALTEYDVAALEMLYP